MSDVSAAFWNRVEKGAGCWLWTGPRFRDNRGLLTYGRLTIKGHRVYAHRIAYAITYGDPGGKGVLHRCDNPPCVRPEHLFLGTQAENNRDMEVKGRARHLCGEAHYAAKMTEDGVRELRRRRVAGESLGSLARAFKLSKRTVLAIVRLEAWASVTDTAGDVGGC